MPDFSILVRQIKEKSILHQSFSQFPNVEIHDIGIFEGKCSLALLKISFQFENIHGFFFLKVKFMYEVFRKIRPGVPLLALYGKQKQLKRIGVYTRFCNMQHALLFATDIAARGLGEFISVSSLSVYFQGGSKYIFRN